MKIKTAVFVGITDKTYVSAFGGSSEFTETDYRKWYPKETANTNLVAWIDADVDINVPIIAGRIEDELDDDPPARLPDDDYDPMHPNADNV